MLGGGGLSEVAMRVMASQLEFLAVWLKENNYFVGYTCSFCPVSDSEHVAQTCGKAKQDYLIFLFNRRMKNTFSL